MRSKELRAKRAQIIEEAKALLSVDQSDEALARHEEMHAEGDKLKGQIDRIEAAEDREKAAMESLHASASVRGISVDHAQDEGKLEAETFNAYLRHGPMGLNPKQQEVYQRRFLAPQGALGTAPDTAGGYTIPDGPMQALEEAMKEYGGMLLVSDILDTSSGNPIPMPTTNDTSNSGAILGENTQASEQDVTFGAITLNAYTYTSKLVRVSRQLLQDNQVDIGGRLAGMLGTRIARITNTHFTTGDGASKPTGIVTAATLGYTAGGSSSSGETATVLSDDLIELEHSVDPAYRNGARWMVADATLKVIKKLKDGQGRPLWLPGLQVREPDTILQYPYTVNQDMATPAASAKTVLFGNFKKYMIRRVSGAMMMRLEERYADYFQVGFVAFQRWDGNLIDAGTHPIKYLQQSAT